MFEIHTLKNLNYQLALQQHLRGLRWLTYKCKADFFFHIWPLTASEVRPLYNEVMNIQNIV